MMTGIEKQVASNNGMTDAQFEAARTAYLAQKNMNLDQYFTLPPEEVDVIEKSGVSATDYSVERSNSMAQEIVTLFRETVGSDTHSGLTAIEAEVATRAGISPEDFIKARDM